MDFHPPHTFRIRIITYHTHTHDTLPALFIYLFWWYEWIEWIFALAYWHGMAWHVGVLRGFELASCIRQLGRSIPPLPYKNIPLLDTTFSFLIILCGVAKCLYLLSKDSFLTFSLSSFLTCI